MKRTLRFLCPPTGGFSAVGNSLRLMPMANWRKVQSIKGLQSNS